MGFNKGNKFGGNRGGGRDFGGGGRDRGRSDMHKAVCNECGNSCEVPFRPTGDKPVYCSDCFRNKNNDNSRGPRDGGNRGGGDRGSRSRFGGDRPRHDGGNRGGGDSRGDFERLSAKLDKIISLLSPDEAEQMKPKKIEKPKKAAKKEVDTSVVKAEVEKTLKKAKKTVAKKAVAKKKGCG